MVDMLFGAFATIQLYRDVTPEYYIAKPIRLPLSLIVGGNKSALILRVRIIIKNGIIVFCEIITYYHVGVLLQVSSSSSNNSCKFGIVS